MLIKKRQLKVEGLFESYILCSLVFSDGISINNYYPEKDGKNKFSKSVHSVAK